MQLQTALNRERLTGQDHASPANLEFFFIALFTAGLFGLAVGLYVEILGGSAMTLSGASASAAASSASSASQAASSASLCDLLLSILFFATATESMLLCTDFGSSAFLEHPKPKKPMMLSVEVKGSFFIHGKDVEQ